MVDGAKRAAMEAAAPAAARDKHAEVYPYSGNAAGKDDDYYQHHHQQQPSSQSLAPYRVAAEDVDVRFNMLGDLLAPCLWRALERIRVCGAFTGIIEKTRKSLHT